MAVLYVAGISISDNLKDIPYHVDSGVVCSTSIGSARASVRGMDNPIPRFFMSHCE